MALASLSAFAVDAAEDITDCSDCDIPLVYDIRVGPLQVGTLEGKLSVADESYELEGSIIGKGPIARLLDWKGDFAAEGNFVEGFPEANKYLLLEREEKKGKVERKTIVLYDGKVRIIETGHPSIEREAPRGIDMMSAILINTQCRDEMVVHDGEDPFIIRLKKREEDKKVRQGRKHFSGLAEMCQYEFIYDEDEVRKVDIWIAEFEGRRVAVRVRFRIPVIPDGVFKLRLPPELPEESNISKEDIEN